MRYENYFSDLFFFENGKEVSLYFESPLLKRMESVLPELKEIDSYSEAYVTYNYNEHRVVEVEVMTENTFSGVDLFDNHSFLEMLTEEELTKFTKDVEIAFYKLLKENVEYAKLRFRDKVKEINKPLYYYLINNKFETKINITEQDFELFGYDINSFETNFSNNEYNYDLSIYDMVDTKEMIDYIQKDLYSEKSAFYEMGQVEGMVGAIDNVINETLSDGYELSFNELIIEAFKRTLEKKEIIKLVFGYSYALYLSNKIESEERK